MTSQRLGSPLLVGLLLVTVLHQRLGGQEGPASLAKLKSAIQEQVDRNGRGAVGIALVSSDETVWAAGLGTADPDSGRPATESSYWRAGSISKSFVGLSALILAERDELRLTDTVAKLAPEIDVRNQWKHDDPVRLVHLMEHTAGLDDLRLKDYASNDPSPLSLIQGLDHVSESLYSRWPPGLHWSYSNAGPALAAYIVQKVDGRLFEEFVEDEIIRPLRMTGASFLLTEGIRDGLAKGYDASGGAVAYRHIVVRPSGALNVTPLQMANFVRMLINRGELDGRRLVSPSSIERMERSNTTLSSEMLSDFGYGLGNASWREAGLVFRGHNGGMPGYRSEYGYLPNEGLGYCVFVSHSNAPLFRRVRDLARGYLVRDVEPRSKQPVVQMPAEIHRWTGHYRPVTPRQEAARYAERMAGVARVAAVDDRLTVSHDGRAIEFYPVGGRAFRRRPSPVATLALVEGPDGTRYLQGEIGNFAKVAAVVVWLEQIGFLLLGSLMVSSPVWVIALISLRLSGRYHRRSLKVSVWPFLAVMSYFAAHATKAVLGRAGDGTSSVDRFGGASLTGVAYVFFSWTFVVLALFGIIYALRTGPQRAGRFAYYHALAVSCASLAVAAYMLCFRAIGVPPWW